MAWVDLHMGILEEFASMCWLLEREHVGNQNEGGWEMRRRAWRARNQGRGLCSSCKEVAVTEPGKWPLCRRHLEANRARARASWKRKTAA